MADIVFVFLVCLASSLIVSELFRKAHMPRIVGQIVAGVILGIPLLRIALFQQGSIDLIEQLAHLGIIFLLFLTGLEINYKQMLKQSREAVLIAVSAAIVPFVFGALLAKFLGYPDLIALVLGACLSLTAEATKAKVLMDFGKLNSRLGQLMLGASTIDDIFEVLFLSMILIAVHDASASSLQFFPVALVAFIAICFFAVKIIPRLVSFTKKQPSDIGYLSVAIIIGLGIAWLSGFLGLGPIIGALIAGIILQVSLTHKIEQEIVRNLKVITFALIVPFFFISIGLNFNPESLALYPVTIMLVTAAAVLGKLVGAWIIKPLSRLNFKQLTLVGWGMNSRGAVELVIAELARRSIPNFPIEIYSAIVFMAVFTTILFPLALNLTLKRNPQIME